LPLHYRDLLNNVPGIIHCIETVSVH